MKKFEVTINNVEDNKEITIDGESMKIIAKGDLKNELTDKFKNYDFDVTDVNGGKKIVITQKTGKETDKESMKISYEGKAQVVTVKDVGIAAKDEELSDGKAHIQVGANSNQSMKIEIGDMRAKALNIVDERGNSLSVLSAEDANKAITAFDAALNEVSSQRANLGAVQNRLEYTISNLDNTAENLTSAESTLRDVDMAKEMMEYSKNNILNQAAQAMISQANQQPQNVLQLLR